LQTSIIFFRKHIFYLIGKTQTFIVFLGKTKIIIFFKVFNKQIHVIFLTYFFTMLEIINFMFFLTEIYPSILNFEENIINFVLLKFIPKNVFNIITFLNIGEIIPFKIWNNHNFFRFQNFLLHLYNSAEDLIQLEILIWQKMRWTT